MEFIQANEVFIDGDILVKIKTGHKVAMNDALNQIHLSSLRYRENVSGKELPLLVNQETNNTNLVHRKTYSQVVMDLRLKHNFGSEWKDVYRKKKLSNPESKKECTIFISEIPNEASSRDIWEF